MVLIRKGNRNGKWKPSVPAWESPRLLELVLFYSGTYVYFIQADSVCNSCKIKCKELVDCGVLISPIVPDQAHGSKPLQWLAVVFNRRGNGTTCFAAPAYPSGFSCFFLWLFFSYILCQGHSPCLGFWKPAEDNHSKSWWRCTAGGQIYVLSIFPSMGYPGFLYLMNTTTFLQLCKILISKQLFTVRFRPHLFYWGKSTLYHLHNILIVFHMKW